ncbi:PREDICTED: uncharacterized protein LOC108756492 isoform X2 [Trachymyrmex septentrionalis]|uniref:uncharacterized protein LOC108756492 isoform X2 n=1 Tax=Trachymyrmex septentrionalis TaxID=34720 RepID=UPI00084F33A5|nr:PREDICTED: uncharacterized protein LOC108756492 isoform X2 [Trachymyrmex septentrionalis]
MMIISIITILLLTRGIFSSLPVQGSISMIHDNTMLIDLRANKLSDFEVRNDVRSMLWRVPLLMQEYGNSYKRLTHQNSNAYEILRHVIIPQDEDSINLDENDFALSWMISNLEFAMEMKRLITNDELSLEYTKSILLWLNKLFDLKWQQFYDDLDYISKWQLLNLKRQAEFFFKNLSTGNQQHEKSKDDKYISEDGNNSESTKNVDEIILTKQNKGNLIETKIETKININKFPMNTSNNTSKIEEQIMDQESIKRTEDDTKNFTIIPINQEFTLNTPTDVKDTSIINDTFFSEILKTFRDDDLIKRKIVSKLKEFIDIRHEHMKLRRKQFNQLKNLSLILLNKIITSTSQEIDQRNVGTDVTLHGSLKNIRDIRKIPFRRTLQVLTPSNKNKKQKNRHISTKNIFDKHHYFNKRKEIKSDNGSAMDEILEAVDEVLPTDKSVEMPPKRSNTFSRIF